MTMFWIGGNGDWDNDSSGHWSNTSGGANNGTWPSATTDVVIDSNSGTPTITVSDNGSGVPRCKTLTTAGSNCIIARGSVASLQTNGNTNLTSATNSDSVTVNLSATGTLTTGGVSIGSFLINLGTTGHTITLADDLITSGGLICPGTFDANNKNVTISSVNLSTTGSVSMGSGTWTLTGAGAVWDASSTSGTVTPSTSTVKLTNSSASAKTFAGGGKTYNNFWNATAGSGVVTLTGSNTFNDFKIDSGRTQQFTAGTTTTVTTFTANGAAGNLITLASDTASSHTLAKAGGGTISVSYMSISRSTATPGSTWTATHSTDGGNNSGWSFPAAASSGFFLFF